MLLYVWNALRRFLAGSGDSFVEVWGAFVGGCSEDLESFLYMLLGHVWEGRKTIQNVNQHVKRLHAY